MLDAIGKDRQSDRGYSNLLPLRARDWRGDLLNFFISTIIFLLKDQANCWTLLAPSEAYGRTDAHIYNLPELAQRMFIDTFLYIICGI